MIDPTHYTLDMFGCDDVSLSTEVSIRHYIEKVCSSLNLTRHGDPVIEHLINPDDVHCSGFTATQVLAESLLSLHTYGEHQAIYIDLFSCRPFDSNRFLGLTKAHFLPTRIYLNRVYRPKLDEVEAKCGSPPPVTECSDFRPVLPPSRRVSGIFVSRHTR